MDYVPVISLSFGGYEHYSGFKITPLMLFTGLRSLIYGDTLMLLKNQCLPYETNPGDTRKVIQKWIAELTGQFRRKQGLTPKAMQKNLRAMAKDFHEIPRDAERLHKSRHRRRDLRQIFLVRQQRLRAVPALAGVRIHGPGRVRGSSSTASANIEMDHKYYGGQQAQAPHRSQGGATLQARGNTGSSKRSSPTPSSSPPISV